MFKTILNKQNIIYTSITIITIISFTFLIYFVLKPKKNANIDLSTIDKGLSPIKILQVKDGKEQEVNFTRTGAEILAASLMSENQFVEEIQNNVRSSGISRIELPPLAEENINVIYSTTTNASYIDNYLTNLYNIFRDNSIKPNINQLSENALSGKTQEVQSLLSKNTDLYLALFAIEVPSEVIKLHKAYIRIVQIQNSFLLGLLNASSDPLKLDINNKLTVSLLSKLDILIKQELDILRQKYNLIYKKP